jgi:membrane-bound metal-dependent hydrolase YbcI (DUF457 family)
MPSIDTGLSFAGAILIHEIIDTFGHEQHFWQSHPRRIKFTHSLFGVIMLSMVLTILIGLPAGLLSGVKHYLIFWPVLASGLSHLLLDALTPQGVYICGKRVTFRVARSSNPLVNTVLQFAGVALLCYAFCFLPQPAQPAPTQSPPAGSSGG